MFIEGVLKGGSTGDLFLKYIFYVKNMFLNIKLFDMWCFLPNYHYDFDDSH